MTLSDIALDAAHTGLKPTWLTDIGSSPALPAEATVPSHTEKVCRRGGRVKVPNSLDFNMGRRYWWP